MNERIQSEGLKVTATGDDKIPVGSGNWPPKPTAKNVSCIGNGGDEQFVGARAVRDDESSTLMVFEGCPSFSLSGD